MSYFCKQHPEQKSETPCRCKLCGAEMCEEEKSMKEQIMEVQDTINTITSKGWGGEPSLSDKVKESRELLDKTLGRIENFDENQPRIPAGEPGGGQWVAEGGTVEAVSPETPKVPFAPESLGFKANKVDIKKALASGLDTQAMYSTSKKGAEAQPGEIEWTPERKALHEKILDKLLKSGVPSSEKKIQFIGGATANGKSSLLKSGHFEGVIPPNVITVDQDHIKTFLPEYAYLVEKGVKKAAAFAHEESSYLSKELVKRAYKMGTNMVQDSVFNEGFEKVAKKLQAAKDAGYDIRMDYVSLDGDKSLALAKKRYEETGRYVPTRYIKKVNKGVTDTWVKLAHSGIVKELRLWDTNENGNPRHVATAKDGNIEVHEPELWHNFLMKERPKSKRKPYRPGKK